MKDQINDVLNTKINGKQFLVPLITIIAFVLVVGGVSYAYFGFSTVTNASVYANVSTPSAVNKSIIVGKTDCELNVSMENMLTGMSSNNTPVVSSQCDVHLEMSGSVGDYCNFNVKLENVGTIQYSPSVSLTSNTYEYKGVVTLAELEGDLPNQSFSYIPAILKINQMNVLTKSNIATNERISIDTAGKNKYRYYQLETFFYNLEGVDQKGLIKSTTGTTTYKHQLKVTDLECNWNH